MESPSLSAPGAIDHEVDCAAAPSQPLSRGTVAALQADLTHAQAHGDVEWLATLWRGLPALVRGTGAGLGEQDMAHTLPPRPAVPRCRRQRS